jgi:hypothetical protein
MLYKNTTYPSSVYNIISNGYTYFDSSPDKFSFRMYSESFNNVPKVELSFVLFFDRLIRISPYSYKMKYFNYLPKIYSRFRSPSPPENPVSTLILRLCLSFIDKYNFLIVNIKCKFFFCIIQITFVDLPLF